MLGCTSILRENISHVSLRGGLRVPSRIASLALGGFPFERP
jgi:hypothetical protein